MIDRSLQAHAEACVHTWRPGYMPVCGLARYACAGSYASRDP